MAQWLSWLERRPVTAEVESSSLFWVVIWGLSSAGRASALQAEGHRFEPYRPHIFFYIVCRSGGTGRRPGLKIPWVVIPVPVRFRSAALMKSGRNVEFTAFLFFLAILYIILSVVKNYKLRYTVHQYIGRKQRNNEREGMF